MAYALAQVQKSLKLLNNSETKALKNNQRGVTLETRLVQKAKQSHYRQASDMDNTPAEKALKSPQKFQGCDELDVTKYLLCNHRLLKKKKGKRKRKKATQIKCWT